MHYILENREDIFGLSIKGIDALLWLWIDDYGY